MCWFSIDCCFEGSIILNYYTGVEEGEFVVLFWFYCKLDVGVDAIDVLGESFYCVLVENGEGIINIPIPHTWFDVWGSDSNASSSKSSIISSATPGDAGDPIQIGAP